MFIEKIKNIKGVGKFYNFTPDSSKYNWDGTLGKTTLIYADNASGKTTLTQIIKSISKSSDIEELRRRKSFGYESTPLVKLEMLEGGVSSLNVYNGNCWLHQYEHIIVFDTYFVEKNVYIISPSKKAGDADTITAIIGEESLKLYDEIVSLKKELSRYGGKKGNLKKQLKQAEFFEKLKPEMKSASSTGIRPVKEIEDAIKEYDDKMENARKKMISLYDAISITNDSTAKYLAATNRYLSKFAPDITISALSMKSKSAIKYGIKIKGYSIPSHGENSSLKRILSEGEKNALAFSFFLARLDVLSDIDKYLVVFDDPLSSLDAVRRHSTISQLCCVSDKVAQLILLSHDKYFIRDFVDSKKRYNKNESPVILKICWANTTSAIYGYDIQDDTKTGLAKHLDMLFDFRNNGEESRYSVEEVKCAIRPVVEGYLRLKYSASGVFVIKNTLGSMISIIKKNEGGLFTSIQAYVNDLQDINIYASQFHHSDPSIESSPAITSELRNYCTRVLDLLGKI